MVSKVMCALYGCSDAKHFTLALPDFVKTESSSVPRFYQHHEFENNWGGGLNRRPPGHLDFTLLKGERFQRIVFAERL